jgi:hypothetical protein
MRCRRIFIDSFALPRADNDDTAAVQAAVAFG